MSNDSCDVPTDTYLTRLKNAKDTRAVIKAEFSAFASGVSEETRVFAYEGVNDKCVYYHWILRIAPEIKYEPFLCKSKLRVLQLFDCIADDLTGLGERTYFFVDSDFDGLQGRAITNKIFVTTKYSIESYLVCPKLLDDLLKIEFHCDGYPEDREKVREVFKGVFDQFLAVTSDINFRIYAARKLGIRQTVDLTSKINELARVELLSVAPSGKSAHELVMLAREPSDSELDTLSVSFQKLDPSCNYRGKFSFVFFVKWLELLRQDRLSEKSVCFSSMASTEFHIDGNFSLKTLAPKAAAPEGLSDFLSTIH